MVVRVCTRHEVNGTKESMLNQIRFYMNRSDLNSLILVFATPDVVRIRVGRLNNLGSLALCHVRSPSFGFISERYFTGGGHKYIALRGRGRRLVR